jgi:monoterpene epsilon-lactone hydrolase
MMFRRLTKWTINAFLRFLRARLGNVDVAGSRRWAARVDWLLGHSAAEVTTTRVDIGACTATWIDVPGAKPDRVILYIHGGAFIMETPRIHATLLAQLCRGAKARGLMVAYRLAPEHKFPAAMDDCLAAYRYLLDSGIASSQIVIAGDSAGGNLALVTLQSVRDAGLPLPCGAVALSPVTDATFSGDSMQRNDGLDPLFTRAIVGKLAPLYVPENRANEPYLSPLFGSLEGLPPTLLMVGSSELLLDDSVRYATRARDVTLEVWHDMPHAFPAFPMLAESGEAIERIGEFMTRCFARSTPGTIHA